MVKIRERFRILPKIRIMMSYTLTNQVHAQSELNEEEKRTKMCR